MGPDGKGEGVREGSGETTTSRTWGKVGRMGVSSRALTGKKKEISALYGEEGWEKERNLY